MHTRELLTTLTTLFGELIEGSAEPGAYMLNRGDVGLLRSLDTLTARDASAAVPGGGSIAAHVDHVRYGLSLLNRWSAGENPFAAADWSASWRITEVTEDRWREIRAQLRDEARRWLATLAEPREVNAVELNGMVASIGHTAYHLGAIRQINRAARGPSEEEVVRASS